MQLRITRLNANIDPEKLAALARLRYVSDETLGYTRRKSGSRFVYYGATGARLRDARLISRIDSLAIPPAWRDVWICRFTNGHLQATGRDSRKRKQYVYHPRWQEVANLAKFWRLRAFGAALPKLRRTIAQDLAGSTLTRRRVLAGVVGLLDATSIRVGNEEYAAQNGSYGLTTLRDRHVSASSRSIELRFVGKGGLRKQTVVDEKYLVRLIKQARAIPGPRLFQYLGDDGKRHSVTAIDANDYLREATGESFTAKDFRTWKASALAAHRLYERCDVEGDAERRRTLKSIIDEAAESLGNTPTVCRNYYIHPGLITAYLEGAFGKYFHRFTARRRQHFHADEQIFDRFLESWEAASTAKLSA